MQTDTVLKRKFDAMLPHLDEHTARLYLGSEAISIGRGGRQKVSKIAGVSRRVRIDKGIAELSSTNVSVAVREQKIRKSGGGRKLAAEDQQGLLEAVEAIVNPHTRPEQFSNHFMDDLKRLASITI